MQGRIAEPACLPLDRSMMEALYVNSPLKYSKGAMLGHRGSILYGISSALMYMIGSAYLALAKILLLQQRCAR